MLNSLEIFVKFRKYIGVWRKQQQILILNNSQIILHVPVFVRI